MKIKRLNLYTYILYIMLAAYMLGPALSFKVGVPRIDNPLTLIFVLLGFVVFFLESKHIPRKIFAMLCALTAMCIWPAIHMGITSLTPTQYMDILFFMAVPAFFYLFYQVLKRADDPLGTIQKFLVVFTLFIAVPPFAELATGIQFVSASDELAIDEGSLKGLFFNPNNLAATAVCLAPAILFFFQLQGRKHKEKLLGWSLFLLLGMAIFASVSRTAIGCYLLILLVYTAYRKNGFITVGVAGLLALVLSMIPSRAIAEFLLSLNGNQFLERFSSRVYLFLYDLGSDNSVSYRQEIYNYFWNNPPLLLTGYGPKNFREYFGGHLSDSLGFENPHSFIIELYLGFGIISLLGFIAFAAFYFLYTASNRAVTGKSRVLAWVALGIFLLAGYGPKNFREYCGGHLSGSLGFENPHSFIIELYLGFGMISLLGFIAFAAFYFLYIASNRAVTGKSRVLAWVALGIFLLAGFIPSTILRMPFIWLPCLLIFIYSVFVAPKLKDMAAYAYNETLYDTKKPS